MSAKPKVTSSKLARLERKVIAAAISWGIHIGKDDWPERFGTRKFDDRCVRAGRAEARFADAVSALIAARREARKAKLGAGQ